MKLFELDDSYNVIFNPEVFLLKDFRDLRDSRKKDTALLYKEMAFIYYFMDLRSDFQFELNPTKREEDVIRFVGLPGKWKPDKHIKTCLQVYEYLSETVSSRLLKTAYLAVDKFSEQINEINLNERDTNNKPIWNQKQIMDSVKTIPELLESISKAEVQFLKNQATSTKLKGDKVKTLYEDGFAALKIGGND